MLFTITAKRCGRAVAAAFAAVLAAAVPAAVTAEPVTLKTTSQFRVGDSWDTVPQMIRNAINERMGDKLRVHYLGGPEVISGFEQGAALRDGTIDLLVATSSWTSSLWPMIEAYDLILDQKPWDEDASGLTAFLEKGYAKHANAKFLGRDGLGVPVVFYTLFKPETVDDFRDRLIRVTPLHREAAVALGAQPVTMPPPDMYAALDRGTIDGLGWPTMGLQYQGVTKLLKYRIEPGFYQQKWAVLMNLDTWNSLSSETQDELLALIRDLQHETYDIELAQVAADTEAEKADGIEIVTLSDEEAERYRKITFEGKWSALKAANPEEAAELAEIMGWK